MDIRRGIIRAFDSGTYLADVQIVGSMATVLTGVPVAKQIAADLLTSGTKCGVLFFDETNPSDACVVFIYDGAPVPWITSALIKDGEVAVGDLALATIQALGSIFIPAMAFDVTRGFPSRGELGAGGWHDMATWLFDDSAHEAVGTQFVAPLTGDIEIKYYFAMESATSGNVRLWTTYLALADGEDAGGAGTAQAITVAVPGTAKHLKVITPVSSTAITAGDLLRLAAGRAGASAADTATGDLHFLGLGIRYL